VLEQIESIDTDGFDTGGNLDSLNSGIASGSYIRSGGGVTIVGGGGDTASTNVTGNFIIYVEGDVAISNSIQYSTSVLWNIPGTPGAAAGAILPSVKVYATGDIYIESDVTQLDGEYVAGGDIHTCSEDNSGGGGFDLLGPPVNQTFIANSCKNALSVNGSLKARRVHFLRTNGTVLNGIPQELHNGSISSAYNPSSNIAESIRFSPEAYLLQPRATVSETQNDRGPKYQSIISRPPTF
jgi:hypothetical protein